MSAKRTVLAILFWLVQLTWGLPQTLIGFFVQLFWGKSKNSFHYGGARVQYNEKRHLGSISLGGFISLCNGHDTEYVCKHEYGHCLQSLILGPFWLFIIGIPSFVWAGCFDNYRTKHNISYYDFYTEKWANKLGGNI